MDIEAKLLHDMKVAMKSGDKVVLETMRLLRSQLKNASISKRKDLSDQDVIDVLTKEAKRRNESVEMYEKGGRPELAEKERQEHKIISSYLPQQLSSKELDCVVTETIAQTGAEGMQSMGQVMGVVMSQVKGRAEGALVQEMVKKRLS